MSVRIRRAAVAATLVAVAVPAVALAATPKTGTFKAPKGQIQRGYDLKFTVDQGGKRIKNVVAHVLESCDGSSDTSVTTVGPSLTWKVSGGKFSGRKKESKNGVTVYTTLKGKFTGATTAKGIIRQESVVAGSVCDTYELKFTAKR